MNLKHFYAHPCHRLGLFICVVVAFNTVNAQNTINVATITDMQDCVVEYPTENIVRMFSNTTTQTVELRDNTTIEMPLNTIKNLRISKQPSDGYSWANMAKGKAYATGTYQSELDASCIVDDYNAGYVDSYPWWKKNRNTTPKHYVVIVHDDCPISDLVANRKIYSKYDAKASFCYIFTPFYSIDDRDVRLENMPEMISDNQEFGLHALFGKSYWRTNKLFDLKPDGSSNFAPQLSDLLALGSSSKVSSQYVTAGSYANLTFSSVDEATLNEINALYTIYGDNSITWGVDLNSRYQQKTPLQWLEYFYNELVDQSIGYSSTSATLSERFETDYDIPEGADINDYYPDKEHLLNGKMVYYADVSNPNYNNPEFQKVGKFIQGLFKGSFSTCNYEVLDRVIEVSKAFLQHYYGFNNITDCHSHGGYYCKMVYRDENGIRYDNSEKTIVHGAYGRFYKSSEQQFISEIDLFSRYGINQNVCSSHFWANGYEGECGVYFGQDAIRDNRCSDRFGASDMYNCFFGYLNAFGNAEDEEMDYATYLSFLNGIDDWTKFLYENAGNTISNNGVSFMVFPHLYYSIMAIKSTIGTGKIPVLKFDTIRKNPAISTALELLLRYCYLNNIEVIGIDKAKQIASLPYWDYSSNLFHNTDFNQSLLDYFRGDSNDESVYCPDGWCPNSTIANGASIVRVEELETDKQMTIQAGSATSAITTSFWGLEPGNYTLSYRAKSQNSNSETIISLKECGMRVNSYPISATQSIGSDYQVYEMHFTIPDFVKHPVTGESSGVQLLCNGCEDNVQRVVFAIKVGANDKVYFMNPTLTKDN